MGYLDQTQHRIVSEAVAEAELHTAGEIVTVLADRSDGYTDVALVWAVTLAFTAMSVFALIPAFQTRLQALYKRGIRMGTNRRA